MIDKNQGTWTGLVDYYRDNLQYSHWVHGDLIEIDEPLRVVLS